MIRLPLLPLLEEEEDDPSSIMKGGLQEQSNVRDRLYIRQRNSVKQITSSTNEVHRQFRLTFSDFPIREWIELKVLLEDGPTIGRRVIFDPIIRDVVMPDPGCGLIISMEL
jgi:hypothetical protein